MSGDHYWEYSLSSEDGEGRYVDLPLDIDVYGLLEILQKLYAEALATPEVINRWTVASPIAMLQDLELIRSLDIDKARAETDPEIARRQIEMWEHIALRNVQRFPVLLLASIVALEIFVLIDENALAHLRDDTGDPNEKGDLIERLRYLVDDGFEPCREEICRQLSSQLEPDN